MFPGYGLEYSDLDDFECFLEQIEMLLLGAHRNP